MRILFAADVSPDPDSGAAGTQVRVVRWLREAGHDVEALWAEDFPHRIRHGNLHQLWELPRACRDLVRSRWQHNTYDVVCVNQPMGYLAARDHLLMQRPGVFVRWSMGLECDLQQALNEWLPKWGLRRRSRLRAVPGWLVDTLLHRQDALSARHAFGHVVLCERDRALLINVFGVHPDRVACVGQAPLEILQATPPRSMDAGRLNRILTVGQFVPYKGTFHIAETVNRVLLSKCAASFTWAGFGAEKSDEAMSLVERQVRTRVCVPGRMDADAFVHLYDSHGIFLFPSIHEGFGKAFLEAMARGLCVVATRVGGMADVVKHGENGFLVEPGDVNGMVQWVEWLMSHPEDAQRISVAAARTASSHTWERVAANTAEFFERLLAIRALEAHERINSEQGK